MGNREWTIRDRNPRSEMDAVRFFSLVIVTTGGGGWCIDVATRKKNLMSWCVGTIHKQFDTSALEWTNSYHQKCTPWIEATWSRERNRPLTGRLSSTFLLALRETVLSSYACQYTSRFSRSSARPDLSRQDSKHTVDVAIRLTNSLGKFTSSAIQCVIHLMFSRAKWKSIRRVDVIRFRLFTLPGKTTRTTDVVPRVIRQQTKFWFHLSWAERRLCDINTCNIIR